MTRVIVAGSGVAGLAAAYAAAGAGAGVTVLESTGSVGGTTCLSGGISWVPNNHLMRQGEDSSARAFEYLSALGLGDSNPDLCRAYAEEAGGTVASLPVGWHRVDYPDYHAERPGGSPGGRSLEPDLVHVRPEVAAMVREAPNVRAPITYAELTSGRIDRSEVEERRRRGLLSMGRGLIAALLQACLDAGVEVRVNSPLEQLPAGDRVVLATGGFERDPELARAFLRGPLLAPTGAPGARGVGLRLAMAAGAQLGNMSEAWWAPAMQLPGETIDGEPLSRLLLTERSRPGSLIVDSRGHRFFDEQQNYNDAGRALHDFDPGAYAFPRVPSWLVFDATYRRSYHLGPLRRDDPDPGWLLRAESLGELAELMEVPPAALEASVERFNEMAARGVDEDFGRGSRLYDRFLGPWGPLGDGPYHAVRVLPGCLGTKGGPRTDDQGRVRAIRGGFIEGLFAAGNAAANPFGMAYPGAGGTIGPALVFGARAGRAAASSRPLAGR